MKLYINSVDSVCVVVTVGKFLCSMHVRIYDFEIKESLRSSYKYQFQTLIRRYFRFLDPFVRFFYSLH